ncbi:putative nuclease of restriction endonuclease-like (RecB) superfamily [Chitinophaga terrae (ex Kim and Jung 2007)]|uniref:PDDEXK nuclease domain-containing protein n=1 Tax=Chitinophaga terrae (ex Kim and Jung 2007) TaxID=408074 RepID=UPI00277DC661|nr:PDDEXK nuclease domain-containing protein [Chitinophaga terrae (ex Kim and Jung 2007)]MDQ0107445.1 putative nuclease of restriction endonuclease-like (RecB) superfamily [Chitinophaga terrae (ex Kim and Jung 2007)]
MGRKGYTPSREDLNFFASFRELIQVAHTEAVRNVNTIMVHTYFEIGSRIIEHEQAGTARAEYGQTVLKALSNYLTSECGKGYSVDNLERARKFYLLYNYRISATPSRKFEPPFTLSWSLYVELLKINDPDERQFYEREAHAGSWSLRELQRQYQSSLYERLALSRDKEGVSRLAAEGQILEKTTDALKHSYVLEFLDLHQDHRYSESDLETAIITRLEHFMLELGKGFLYEGRQRRISLKGDHYYIDLVFYNRLLRSFVLLDLKIGRLSHQDIGQMQMYVNYYDRIIKTPEENPTIGIILCKEGNDAVVEFTLPQGNTQIFAKEYKLYLPSKDDLRKQLD